MSCECKFKGKCKDCNKKYPEGTTINKNANDNWCSDGKSCTGCKSAPTPAKTLTPDMHTFDKLCPYGENCTTCNPQPAAEKAPTSEEFLESKKDEIKSDEQAKDQAIQSLMKKHFTGKQITKLTDRMEKQMVLEYIAETSLSNASSFPVNPAKTGMHTKFLEEYMTKTFRDDAE